MLQFESLGLVEAEKAIAAGLAAAHGLKKAMAFAVADHAGETIASVRMDGANPRILRHSIRKAYTAALMCRHTLSFKRDLEERNGALDQWGDLQLTTLPGGLAVQTGGKFVGGVGAGAAVPTTKRWRGPWSGRWDSRSWRTNAPAAPEWAGLIELRRVIGGSKTILCGEEQSMRTSVHLPLARSWLELGQEPVTAARIGNMIYTSGVPGIDLKTGQLAQGPQAQFAAAFENLTALLRQAGAGPESIGLLTVWIPDRTNRAFINKDWLSLYPGADRPARKTNQVPLPRGMEVQLMAACVLGESRAGIEIPASRTRTRCRWARDWGRWCSPRSSRRKTPRTANWSRARWRKSTAPSRT